MSATSYYAIRGGIEDRERLRILSRVFAPSTNALLGEVGVPLDARCLDVGCGGGDVAIELARRAADGDVVGIDVDDAMLGLASAEAADARVTNVEFRHGDALHSETVTDLYDLIYTR